MQEIRYTLIASQDFLGILDEARWVLKTSKSALVRDAVLEYLERHLPKEAKEKLLTKGGK